MQQGPGDRPNDEDAKGGKRCSREKGRRGGPKGGMFCGWADDDDDDDDDDDGIGILPYILPYSTTFSPFLPPSLKRLPSS